MEHATEVAGHQNASNSQGGSTSVAPPMEEKKIMLKFNHHGEPVGEDAQKAATHLGYLTRTNISIKYPTWKLADSEAKADVWKSMKARFNFTDAQKGIQMKKAAQAWKKHKYNLRKNFKGNTLDDWIASKPKKITAEDWHAFCVNESTEKQKEVREKNKRIKAQTRVKSTHNTGRYGYARAEHKFIQQYGRKPLLVELWLYTHKRKDGTFAPHDQDNAVKFQQMAQIMLENGEQDTIDSGPLFQAFGVNKRGRTRCVSSVISRRAILASAFARTLLEEIDAERNDVNVAMERLHNDNADLREQIKEFVEGLKNGSYDANQRGQPSSVPYATGGSGDHSSGPSFNTVPDEIRCAILSHYRKVVGYGTKNPPGSVQTVHGHPLKATEARVLVERILDHSYTLWGGEQFGHLTLGDVGVGSFVYWLDELLVPSDD